MNVQTTNGIQISVETQYQPTYSNPNLNKFLFAYFITIVNKGKKSVQLLRRHWFIMDSIGELREVEGKGVIGQQPIIKPGEKFEYNSWTDMKTEIGKMYGYYTVKRIEDEALLQVDVPEFRLIVPTKLN